MAAINAALWRCCATIVLTLHLSSGYPYFPGQIPNGQNVPNPCKPEEIWVGVGHKLIGGSGARNSFGFDFAANGLTWTKALCEMDSDMDGRTNGQELGDVNCTWSIGMPNPTGYTISHPGICEPWNDPKCLDGDQSWVMEACQPSEFKCDAIKSPGSVTGASWMDPYDIGPMSDDELRTLKTNYHLIPARMEPYISTKVLSLPNPACNGCGIPLLNSYVLVMKDTLCGEWFHIPGDVILYSLEGISRIHMFLENGSYVTTCLGQAHVYPNCYYHVNVPKGLKYRMDVPGHAVISASIVNVSVTERKPVPYQTMWEQYGKDYPDVIKATEKCYST